MAEEETNSMDHETVAPERKKSKHDRPGGDRDGDGDVVEPRKDSLRSPVAGDEYSTRRETELRDGSVGNLKAESDKTEGLSSSSDSGREKLKRHRLEVAGSVWIPDIWGQEELMKDWIDCSVFDASLVSSRILSARAALVAEGRRHSSTELRMENKVYS